MKLLKTIEIENIKANSKAKLDGLNDFNIIIGPNNCGKTSILETVLLFQNDTGGHPNLSCPKCHERFKSEGYQGRQLNFSSIDTYLGGSDARRKPHLRLSFYEKALESLVGKSYSKYSAINMDDEQNPNTHLSGDLIFKGDNALILEHSSPFIFGDGFNKLESSILYCPEGRLQTYKEQSIQDYVRLKRASGAMYTQWVNFISKIVDSKVNDYKGDYNLTRELEHIHETSLDRQGTGVKSVACLAIDILTSTDALLLLIDEPELGLNPYSKQLLLQFLVEKSKKKQIIITTHDPTFVNPILWKSSNVSVYLYSPYTNDYVKIDLAQSDTAPETFGGYLSHTNSLRDIHIYVEGPSDVYILQEFLRKYCHDKYKSWSEMINRVGIFHLAGDFWCHLLYTLPDTPYKCIVILDGDKRKKAEKVCQAYAEYRGNMATIKFAASTNEIQSIINNGQSHPVYCLSENRIELYLGSDNDNSPDYNKVTDGPKLAENCDVPKEISDIFDIILPEV